MHFLLCSFLKFRQLLTLSNNYFNVCSLLFSGMIPRKTQLHNTIYSLYNMDEIHSPSNEMKAIICVQGTLTFQSKL